VGKNYVGRHEKPRENEETSRHIKKSSKALPDISIKAAAGKHSDKSAGRHSSIRKDKNGGLHDESPAPEKSAGKEVSGSGRKKSRTAKPEKPVSSGKRLTLIIVAGVLAIIIAIIVSVLGFINSKLNKLDYNDGKLQSTEGIELTEEDRVDIDITGLEIVDELPPLSDLEIIDDDGVINILILGTDERDFEFSDVSRADAIMLMSLNTEDYTIKLVSIERALGVPVLEGENKGQVDLISHCFRWGGADLMMTEIEGCFRVKVDRYVRINLNAFIKIIDVLGGVDIELTETEAWYINTVARGGSVGGYLHHGFYTGDAESEVTEMKPGVNHMSGVMALSYARLRGIDDDWHRIERQRNVVQACVYALKGADLGTLNKLCDEILPLVRTNFTKKEIAALLLKAPGFIGVEIEQMTIPAEGTYNAMYGAGSGDTVYAPIFEENALILRKFFYGE